MTQLISARQRAGFAVAAVASLAVAGLGAGTSYASGTAGGDDAKHGSTRGSLGQTVKDPYVDVADRATHVQAQAPRVSTFAARQPASRQAATRRSGVVTDIAGSTGTVRWQANLDGTLTRPSGRSPLRIALHYVRSHPGLGLVPGDLKSFHLKRNYRDIDGTHHLYFTQRIKGVPASRNGLTASVDKRGRLLTVGGSPITRSALSKLPPASALTITTPAEALSRTRGRVAPGGDTGDTSGDTGADSATRVVFATDDGLRPAWETVVTSSETPATTVIDAVTGRVLQRTPLKQYENSTARVYRFFPGSRRGGRQITVDFTKQHWLGKHAHVLAGNNSHAYSDVDDNNRAARSEEVHPRKGQSWSYRLTPFHPAFAKRFCSNPWPCSWNPGKPFSWRTNRAQNATQVFYFVNNWHDHLQKAPIGFTEAAGNFQLKNHGKHGKGGDPVVTQTDDGANTAHGLPDGSHIDNANMTTPPDGRRPVMQMYLQHEPGTPYGFAGDPFSPTNVGDEADTVYHEYTHGLSGRLNVDVRGRSTLGGVQAGAMGEAWSDWYAMDYLVKKHLQRDRARKADVRLFRYDGLGVDFDRTEPLDCKVGQHARLCNGGSTGHRGGYTYADYGRVVGGPEVHGDGEIWAQTLWDLRGRLGSRTSESLVTRAMELAPYNPSFLDMRNAILVADTAVFHGRHHHAIWKVFAHRGMGFTAGSLGGNDTEPSASFRMPPASITTGTISGQVTDPAGGPIQGVTVSLKFQGAGLANPSVKTDSAGRYELRNVPAGRYSSLTVQGRGYETESSPVTVTAGGATADLKTRRDWAASSGGASIASFTGPAYQACGPRQTIDLSQGTGWSTTSFGSGHTYRSRSLVIDLGRHVDINGFAVDPAATCGDGASASAAGVTILTSTTSGTGPWSATPTSHEFTSADNGRMTEVTPSGDTSNVRYVKLSLTSNQTPHYSASCSNGVGAYSGCTYTDLSEFAVHGQATP